jgi:hypothetical protein
VDVQGLMGKLSGQMFDELLEAVRTFSVSHEFEDDVCLVGVESAGKPPGSPELRQPRGGIGQGLGLIISF